MNVVIISTFCLKQGRGPVFRLKHILPYICKMVNIRVCALGEVDDDIQAMFHLSNIDYRCIPYSSDGWFVQKPEVVAKNVVSNCDNFHPDLIILEWEFWDIATHLYDSFHNIGVKFAVIFHSIPFIDAQPVPTGYWKDYQNRMISESNKMIRDFLVSRKDQVDYYMHKFNIISINETVSYYLHYYFPNKECNYAYPGYALDLKLISSNYKGEKIFDFCYMSKLEKSKGLFEIPQIMKLITETIPNAKIQTIGSFLYENEELEFKRIVETLGLCENIRLVGWLSNKEKYDALKESRVFLYPSISGDTFSFCLLEALVCGMHAVAYDVPFVTNIYKDAPVIRTPYMNNDMFAKNAVDLLFKSRTDSEYGIESINFVKQYYSNWENVAQAEVNAYERIIKYGVV